MPRDVQWTKEFDKQYRKIRKRNSSIEAEISALLEQLQNGKNPGSPYTSIKGAAVKRLKVNVDSLDLRVVYYHKSNFVLLLMILKRQDFSQRSIKKLSKILKREGYLK